ncbi:tunicamycin resistance protein [Spiromyces aspiralis]|uniref:Tunicamycin resistance protein n=1 Tax=Spiromyces aspiralis TaxID=68401 RepID=A0ACC1HFW5_9FUNG|nr:tunicamycin resistance protein [Spiromyces aspiralis]
MFLAAGVSGRDMNKPGKPLLAESMGIIAATIYMVATMIFLPIQFYQSIVKEPTTSISETHTFPYDKLGQYLSALLSLQSMVFLGFADDVLNLKWRFKLFLPTIASIPLLIVYYLSHGVTHVIVPVQMRSVFGQSLDLGPLYYVYMGMMAVFCTNAINILAGVNGVEVGQSLVISMTVAVYNLMRINSDNPDTAYCHLFSLYLILPFMAVSAALFYWNSFPAVVFIGDTYCYFAGMTFAVVGILGHFSKTLLLFFLPQIFNFVYSCPQLFRLVPCPRHRLPQFVPSLSPHTQPSSASNVGGSSDHDAEAEECLQSDADSSHTVTPLRRTDGILEPSWADLSGASATGLLIIRIFAWLGLVHTKYDERANLVGYTNLTLLNLILVKLGPMSERRLVWYTLGIQALGSLLALFIRHNLATLIYEDTYK